MALATSITQEAEETVKQAAKAVEQQIRTGTEKVYGSAKGEAERAAVERRDDVASYVHDISEALGSACHTLEERGRGTAAQFARRAAEEIGSLGDRVRGQDVSGILGDIEDFARRRPAVFFGGAFLVSFTLIRLLARPDVE